MDRAGLVLMQPTPQRQNSATLSLPIANTTYKEQRGSEFRD